MRNLLAIALLLSALAGCTQSPKDEAVPTDCSFPNVTPGSNAYIVGIVRDGAGAALSQVAVQAAPIGSGTSVVNDSTNDSGCFFLGLEPGVHYDIGFTKPGYKAAALQDQSAAAGEKVVRSVTMPAQ